MKKLIALFLIILFVPTIAFASEADSSFYFVNATNYTKNGIVYTDNTYVDSNISVVVNPYSDPLGSVSYEDIYNQDTLTESNQILLDTYTNLYEETYGINTSLVFSYITDLNKYKCFFFVFHLKQESTIILYNWVYAIYSDNYCYIITVNSANKEYVNSNNVKTFLNSFEIKDTTNLCTPTVKNEITPIVNNNINSTTEYQYPYADYTLKDWFSNILFTAIIYLFIPIIIKFVFKKSFETGKAFGISLLHFVLIKLLLSFLLEIEFTTSGWIYLFIGQAIITKKKDAYDNFENSSSEDFIKNEKEIPEEVLNILSDKDRIKNILDGYEKIDESLFLEIENPYNNKIIENSDDIKEYLSSFLEETNNIDN